MTRAKSNSRAGLLQKWFLWLNFAFILILLLTYLTPYVSVKKWGWLSLLALAYPITMLVNGAFATGWLILKKWYAVMSLAVMFSGVMYHMRYVKFFSFSDHAKSCDESVRLMSYNLRGLSMVPVEKGAGIEGKIDSIYKALNDLGEYPDILCLQEASKGEMIAQRFGLKHSLHASKSSLWLLSRYPILQHGELDGEEVGPSCMWADIRTPQGTLRVYNMHLVSNRVTNTTEELIQEMDLKNENTWHNIGFIVRRYRHTTQKRAIEAAALRKHLDKCPYPAVIAGDGNDTPLSNTYHVLADGLKDSFLERGSGFSTTYDSSLPLLRIDYVLGTRDIYFKDLHSHHLQYSDHYPVSTGICVQTPTGS